jgi:diguanylate cyclase (GGDEF)-like protein
MSPVRLPAYRDATRLVGLLLVVVLLGLGVYAVTMDRRSSEATVEAEQSMLLARVYSDVYVQLLELERTGSAFMLAPSRALSDEMDNGVANILVLLDRLTEVGGEDDGAAARFVQEEYLPRFPEVQEFFSAILDGRPYYGAIPSETIITDLRAVLQPRAQMQREKSVAAVGNLRAWQEQRVWTTVGVFAGGVGLALLLVVVLRRTALQAARAQSALTALRRETLTDSLTGLGNHRAFQEVLRGEDIARRGALVLLDLDRFKEVNDLRGHAEGDQLLRKVAATLSQRFPGNSFRIGGDEFAVITDGASAQLNTDSVIRTTRLELTGVTLSAGITSWDAPSFDADLHFAQADAALRWAKREGRNRSVTSPTESAGCTPPGSPRPYDR